MSHEYYTYILIYATLFTNPIVNPRSHKSAIEPKRSEPKPRRESNPTLVQHFPSYAALYPLSYREVVTIKHNTALKNPRRHLRHTGSRPKSYFAVNGKIDTTLEETVLLIWRMQFIPVLSMV